MALESGCKDFSWPNFALAHLFKDFNSKATGNSLNSTMTSICYLVKLSFVYILLLLYWYFVLGGIDALCWNHKFWLQNLPTLFPDRSPEVLFSCREWHCYKYVEIWIPIVSKHEPNVYNVYTVHSSMKTSMWNINKHE